MARAMMAKIAIRSLVWDAIETVAWGDLSDALIAE